MQSKCASRDGEFPRIKEYVCLFARRAVIARNSNLTTISIFRMDTIGIVLAAPDTEPILRGLNKLDVEPTFVVTWEDAEGLAWDTIVALAGRVKLSPLVRRI